MTLAPSVDPRTLTKTCAFFKSGVTLTWLMLTSALSKVTSRAILLLSSRFKSALTRNCRCFTGESMGKWSRHQSLLITPPLHYSFVLEFLRDLLELIALDDVTYLIFAEVAELDAAFQTGTHFFHVVLESAQRRNPAVVNRLAFPQHASAGDAGHATIGNQTTGDDAS